MSIWLQYNADERLVMLQQTAGAKNIVEQAIEKDWWVSAILMVLSKTSWANFLQKETKGSSLWMVTLTYAGVDDWRPNHIREFMQAFRKLYKKKLVGYAWVAELQERGAVHYHVMVYLK